MRAIASWPMVVLENEAVKRHFFVAQERGGQPGRRSGSGNRRDRARTAGRHRPGRHPQDLESRLTYVPSRTSAQVRTLHRPSGVDWVSEGPARILRDLRLPSLFRKGRAPWPESNCSTARGSQDASAPSSRLPASCAALAAAARPRRSRPFPRVRAAAPGGGQAAPADAATKVTRARRGRRPRRSRPTRAPR